VSANSGNSSSGEASPLQSHLASDRTLGILERSFSSMTIHTQKLDVLRLKLLKIKSNALNRIHEVMSRANRFDNVNLQVLTRRAARATTAENLKKFLASDARSQGSF
jgi:hypothetical protein